MKIIKALQSNESNKYTITEIRIIIYYKELYLIQDEFR